MESTVLTPGPGQTVVSSTFDDRHDYGHGYHDMIVREQAAGFRESARDAQTVTRDIKDARYDLGQVADRHAAAAAVASCHTDNRVSDGVAAVQASLCDLDQHIVGGFKDAQALAYQVEGRSLLEQAKGQAAIQLQMTTGFNALSVEAVKNAAAAELRAQQIAAEAAATAAECCCDLKALILAQGEQTRRETLEHRLRTCENDQIVSRILAQVGGRPGNGPGNS